MVVCVFFRLNILSECRAAPRSLPALTAVRQAAGGFAAVFFGSPPLADSIYGRKKRRKANEASEQG